MRLNRELHPELDYIIAKALEKERGTRYQDASEMKADLTRTKRDAVSSSAGTPKRRNTTATRSKYRTPYAKLALLGGIIVAFVIAAFLWQTNHRRGGTGGVTVNSIAISGSERRILIWVFDDNRLPVQGAAVHLTNNRNFEGMCETSFTGQCELTGFSLGDTFDVTVVKPGYERGAKTQVWTGMPITVFINKTKPAIR